MEARKGDAEHRVAPSCTDLVKANTPSAELTAGKAWQRGREGNSVLTRWRISVSPPPGCFLVGPSCCGRGKVVCSLNAPRTAR